MKYCRFQLSGRPQYGLVETVAGREEITRLLVNAPQDSSGDMEDVATKRMQPVSLAGAALLAPVRPSKIVCVGRNYREHAAELGHDVPVEPLIFLKPPSSLLAPGGQIRRPKIAERVDHEGELGVIVARTCYKVGPDEDVRPYILGYTCVNDVTARDLQNKDSQWTRAKGFDTFCPVGAVRIGAGDLESLEVITRVNGVERQRGHGREMAFSIPAVLSYISRIMTLEPGDLVATGSPAGVGPLKPGDLVEVEVVGVATVRNPVISAG